MIDILNIRGLAVDPAKTVEADHQITIAVLRRPRSDWPCNHCGGQALTPNGTRTVNYPDVPVRGKPVTLAWDRQRYRCKDCGKSTPDQHPDLHDDFLMTRRLYKWIGGRCQRYTFADVALDTGMNERSVRRVYESWAEERLRDWRVDTPKWLGMDEVHLLNDARGVLCDVNERTLIDILPDRSQVTMSARVARFRELERIQVVTMDMWPAYRNSARKLLPQARVVVDKWHVTKYADKGMESIRKSHRASLPPKMRRKLVKDRFLLLTRGHRLRPDQSLILETWMHAFPELARAYAAKEAFYGFYDCPTRNAAELYLLMWKDSLTPGMEVAFAELLSALRNWKDEILNYFDHRVTNAYTEAMNGLIKIANRAGRGYSFDVLRSRMLLSRAFKYLGIRAGLAPRGPKYISGVHFPTLIDLFRGGHLGFPPTEFAG